MENIVFNNYFEGFRSLLIENISELNKGEFVEAEIQFKQLMWCGQVRFCSPAPHITGLAIFCRNICYQNVSNSAENV